MPCELVHHTADIGLRLVGRDVNDLLESLVDGLAELVTGGHKPAADGTVRVEIRSESPEGLLVALANEVIFQLEVDRKLAVALHITDLVRGTDLCTLRADVAQANTEDGLTREVVLKAATWHGLNVRKRGDGLLEATMILDT